MFARMPSRAGVGIAAVLFLSGCPNPLYRVATDENALAYYTDRYNEKCPDVSSLLPAGPEPYCNVNKIALDTAHKHVQEEKDALARNGAFPLQHKLVKADAKKLKGAI